MANGPAFAMSGRLVRLDPKTYKNKDGSTRDKILLVLGQETETILYAEVDDPRMKEWTGKVGGPVQVPVTFDTNGKPRLA